jgi:Flp pilus assembly protein TadB/Mg-chelatase subunit ChlD
VNGGRRNLVRGLGALLAGLAVLALPAPSAPAATSPVDLARELLGHGVPAGAQQFQLTAAPRRQGDDVVLQAQVPGVPGRSVPRVVAVDADSRPLDAAAAVTAVKDAPPRTAVLLVDTSGSMSGDGMDAARKAAEIYGNTAGSSVRVGLVAFSDAATVVTPPTTDRAALRKGIRALNAAGETALYDGLILAAHEAGKRGNVVLLSDGGDTVSRAKFRQALDAVSSAGLRVDVIGFNTAESERATLERIASRGRGRVVQAADAAGLGQAFAAAAAAVPLDVTVTVRAPSGVSSEAAVVLVVGGHTYASLVHLPPGRAPLPTPAPAAVQPPVEKVAVPPSSLTPLVLGGMLFALLALAAAAVFWPRDPEEIERQRRQRALGAYGPLPTTGPGPDGRTSAVSSAAAGVLHVSERMVAARDSQRAISLRLDRAGLSMLPHEWLALRTSIVVVAGAVGLLLIEARLLGLLLGVLLGWVATEVWFRVKQSKRCRAFAEQLPDTLQIISSSLRSGFSLPQALAAAQENGAQPMAAELGRALAAARIGIVLEDELDQMAVRMRSEEWRLAVMAIRIQRSVGGSLAEVLATTAKTLRERTAVTRQVRALSAEGRLSAYVLLGLPIAVGLFLVAFRRPYVEPLWTTTAGLAMLVVAAIGMVVGTWWMFKVAKVEV